MIASTILGLCLSLPCAFDGLLLPGLSWLEFSVVAPSGTTCSSDVDDAVVTRRWVTAAAASP